jgi:hypothetical protein
MEKDMIRIMSAVFGVAFIGAGVAGYLPQFTTDGMLLGIFEVNSMHNMIHIASGVVALLAALNTRFARLYFQIFGLVYAATAVAGVLRNGDLFGMHVNMADNYLHAGISVISLYLGFLYKSEYR